MARSLRRLRAGGRLRGGAIVLAPRHSHLRHLSGTGEESIGVDGTAMGQCLAAHGGVPIRSGKHDDHGCTGRRDGGRNRTLDQHRFP